MRVNRRTQRERSTSTRGALIDAALPLFAEHGFAAVGTEAIVRAAGVTRGALYHQFVDKTELFAAVFAHVQVEVAEQIALRLADVADPSEVMTAGIDAWIAACSDPAVQRIVLIEAPVVLGWERWREAGQASGLGLVEAALNALIADRRIRPQPVRPLAHVLMAALDEAAIYIAHAEDQEDARAQMRAVMHGIVRGLERP
jgi:AcrR family transcriptional regulator